MAAMGKLGMKTIVAALGGSAVVAMGALAFTVGQQPQAGPAQYVSAGEMTMGATVTETTPPTAPETAVAVPAVKAGS